MVARTNFRRNVRILLVGERGVGKTSLILSLVSEEFPEFVPAKAEEITIPADVTPEQVPTNIVDFSTVEQTDENLADEIQKANVVCVVYAVDDEESMEQITSYWLPLIRECHPEENCPVVLVGNKIDLVEYSTIDDVLQMMENYPEIESCIECSAKTLKNISEMFYYAQKAVLHPTAPLYIVEKQDLTESCKNALIRIFKICDLDADGLLNDVELNNFQRCCFNAPLQPQVLDDVKTVLRKNVEDGICSNAVTLKGFLFLHSLFIQRGRTETTWAVLRKFGYGDGVTMMKEYLRPTLKVPSGSTTELTPRGRSFLTHLFTRSDKDRDGCLSPPELSDLFSTCPGLPWESSSAAVSCNERGWLTYTGYMCHWALLALIDPGKVMEWLAYLGYTVVEGESQLTAVMVTREKKLDLAKKQSSRSVYQCHVIGPMMAGKTAFCRSFIKNNYDILPAGDMQMSVRHVVNIVPVYGQDKVLVLKEVPLRHVADSLHPQDVQCDVACLIYDVSDEKSFEYAARIYIKYFAESKIPVLVVANKSDEDWIKQEYLLQPADFCSKYKLLPPHPFTSKGHLRREIFVKLATMAAFPPLRRMVHMLLLRPKPSEWFHSFYRHIRQLTLNVNETTVWWKAGLGLLAASAVGLIFVRVLQTERGR